MIGGSLGGNLGLRLGRRRDINANSWLGSGIVSWSPASVWNPFIRNEILRRGPDHCRDNWDLPENALSRANYFTEVFDTNINSVFVRATQPDFWYSKDWEPCKQQHIKEARIARRETYSADFRKWHWRLAGEQLIYSHVDRVDHFDNQSPYRFEANTVRQLLIAGADDNNPTHVTIFDNTQKLAQWMVHTPGKSLFLLHTGHSMHVERPAFLAGEIVKFLDISVGNPKMSFQITCVSKSQGKIVKVGGINRTKNIPFQMTQSECISSIGRGNEFFVVGSDGSQAAVHVVIGQAPKGGSFSYIETDRDDSRADNLRSLPMC